MSTTYAVGVKKIVSIAQETSVRRAIHRRRAALRRVTADFNLNVARDQSQEILPSQQVRDARQGPRQVQGQLTGQLSPQTFKLLFQGLFRNTFSAGVSTSTLTDTVATIDGATGNLIINGASETFLTTGFKNGDVCRFSGLTGGGAADNARTSADQRREYAAHLPAPPVTIPRDLVRRGKRHDLRRRQEAHDPPTGQLDQSYTVEQWVPDIGLSEVFTGCKITQVTFDDPGVRLRDLYGAVHRPADGHRQLAGLRERGRAVVHDIADRQWRPYRLCGHSAGRRLGVHAAGDLGRVGRCVVGTNLIPGVFIGTVRAQGSMTALMENDRLTTDFLNENEVEISVMATTTPLPNADFVSLYLPRAKLMSMTRQDSDRQINRSFNVVALEQDNGGAGTVWDDTTIVMQDSLA